ncbi:XRE family transcriptional regulator [Methanoregula sp.]|jgi:Zn-dependent peptidase ImmA (M78 family)/DNA-binding XRE family transcriptional regulator|uniref:helix-turn-helix domain-containing protein n=1 Tax=Methanoregula sp. TaxID=2052170 RepID=UPI0025D55171|nr:XRE family transcriptional regulator [Methanoregula sp.]
MDLGTRIRMARTAGGLSLRALAEKADISAMAISKYENGKDVPRSGVLIRLSKALDVNVDYFFRTVEVNLSRPMYRNHDVLPKKEENEIHEQIRDLIERYLEIEEIVGSPQQFRMPPKERRRVAELDDAEIVAQNLRSFWKLGTDPIENMIDIFEQNGIKVGEIDGTKNFDALTFFVDEKTPVIVVKKNVVGDRQRFSLAHELGHIVMDLTPGINSENAAHRFAGAFLAPSNGLIADLGAKRNMLDIYELHLLKHKYGISMQALIYRARDLHIITPAKWSQIFDIFTERDWREREPGDQLRPETPNRMKRMIFRALSEHKITRSRAAELIGTDFDQFCRNEINEHNGFPIPVCD